MASIQSETPIGLINGSNTGYTVSNPVAFLSLNGQLQAPGGVDFTLSSNGLGITMVIPPTAGAILLSYYLNNSSPVIPPITPGSSSFITVGTLVQRMLPKLHTGNARTKFGTLYQQIADAAAAELIRIDPPSTIQRSRIDSAIYSHVYNYTCPLDYKGIDRTIDIRPIWSTARPRDGNRYPAEHVGTQFDDTIGANLRQFDIRKFRNTTTVETVAGMKTLRISKHTGAAGDFVTTLSPLNNPDSTVTFSGDIQNLVADNLDYIDYQSSLSFSLSGSTGQGVITVQLPAGIDLSQLTNLGSLFFWLKFPNAAFFTNIGFRFGSDQNNYYANTLTKPQGRPAVDTNAWDMMLVDWTKSTQFGTPDTDSMQWFQFIIDYVPGTILNFCKLNSLTASLGQAYELIYYSSCIFQDATTGVLKQIPTADSDIITLDPPATSILMWETLRSVFQEQQGKNSSADYNTANYVLEGDGRVVRSMLVMNRQGLYRDWIQQNPSQGIPITEQYHGFSGLSGY